MGRKRTVHYITLIGWDCKNTKIHAFCSVLIDCIRKNILHMNIKKTIYCGETYEDRIIIAVIHCEIKIEKKSGLNEIWTHNLCDTGAYIFTIYGCIANSPCSSWLDSLWSNWESTAPVSQRSSSSGVNFFQA